MIGGIWEIASQKPNPCFTQPSTSSMNTQEKARDHHESSSISLRFSFSALATAFVFPTLHMQTSSEAHRNLWFYSLSFSFI